MGDSDFVLYQKNISLCSHTVPPRCERVFSSVPKQNSLRLHFISSGQLCFCLVSVIHSQKNMKLLLLSHSSTQSTLCNLESGAGLG